MKANITLDNISVEKDVFNKIISKIEKILKVNPTKEMEEFSKKMNWKINEKDIIVKGSKVKNNEISYTLEFYSVTNEEKRNLVGEKKYYSYKRTN